MSEIKEYYYKPCRVTECEAFADASAEELRGLVAIIEAGCTPVTADEVATRARISRSRAAAAIALWLDAGVIREADGAPIVTEEFDPAVKRGEIDERPAREVAKTIRRSELADMITECGKLLRRPALNTEEIKELTALLEQYSLTEEYVLTLATFITHGGENKSSVRNLVNAAIKYSTEMDITTVEALEDYIKERENEGAAAKEFRRIFGIYDRPLSKTEAECFRRWSKEYGYFTEIVGEAYDLAVMGGYKKLVFQANRLITRWYETGCRTVAECRARFEEDEAEKKREREAERKEKKAAAKPLDKYTDFDPEEALRLALERSFGSEDEEND